MNTLRLSFLLSLLLLLPFSLFADRCNPEDKIVLLKIKKALNNPYLLASWDSKTACCGWYQLRCDDLTHRVTELTIFGGELTGQIPDAVGDLPYLNTLLFRKLSNLTGGIPPAILKLKNLKTLWLSWTNLSGPVPTFLDQLPNLEYINLSFNNFSGQIPASLANFTKLGALHLDRNRLTGEIPESFGRFKGNVPDLYLSHNQITGKIPESFRNMDFTRIDLSRNKLVGDASMLFDKSKKTETVDISRNLLEFDLSNVTFPVATLIWLDINHNKIYGNIPAEITKVENLQFFNVSYNRLCGEIPSGGRMERFDYSAFFHNRCLCGAPLNVTCK
ncbi:polygalacturonase inhibitor-like [Tasmannia lanceolata]|uniref:polygalacturonase inhibitor-like n=1 Tax=Tasmannia lanceolata TaxID=3420 RepID=UPI004063ECC6